MIFNFIAQSIAIPGAFILVGHKLAFSQNISTILTLADPTRPAVDIWLKNVRLFFPIMIFGVISCGYLTWQYKGVSRCLYAGAGAALLSSGLVTKFAMLPLMEKIMDGRATGLIATQLLEGSINRNVFRVAFCLTSGVLGTIAVVLRDNKVE